MDIDEFLLARWAEVEQAALDAGHSPQTKTRQREWTAQLTEWPGGEHPFLDGVKVIDRNGVAVFIANGGSRAIHAALHDPAAVLADIAMKRAILAEHPQVPADRLDNGPQTGCRTCHVDSHCGETMAEGLCETVRHLAAPHSAHPDYNPDWSLS